MHTTIQNLLSAFDAVEQQITALETQGSDICCSDDCDALIPLVEGLRTLSKRTNDVRHRAIRVLHAIEARITNLRDAQRAA